MRISYPKLKHELFVNFLGYKEPNLVYLWRYKCTNAMANTQIHKNEKTNKPCLTVKVQRHLRGGDLSDRLRSDKNN